MGFYQFYYPWRLSMISNINFHCAKRKHRKELEIFIKSYQQNLKDSKLFYYTSPVIANKRIIVCYDK